MAGGGDSEKDYSKSNEIILSTSTVHHENQHLYRETTKQVKIKFNTSKSEVYWDKKLCNLSLNETGRLFTNVSFLSKR